MKELSLQEAEYIFGADWQNIKDKFLSNCFCGCKKFGESAQITDYNIYLDELNDIIFKGKCADCGQLIARQIETGENPEYLERILKI